MIPPLPEPSLEYFTGRRDPVSIYYRDEILAYGKACHQAALDEVLVKIEAMRKPKGEE